jgi:hypothetical protein
VESPLTRLRGPEYSLSFLAEDYTEQVISIPHRNRRNLAVGFSAQFSLEADSIFASGQIEDEILNLHLLKTGDNISGKCEGIRMSSGEPADTTLIWAISFQVDRE